MEEAERIAREEHGSGIACRANNQVLEQEITIGDWDTGWMDLIWSRICYMTTTSRRSIFSAMRFVGDLLVLSFDVYYCC
jgi:hypothetical protein